MSDSADIAELCTQNADMASGLFSVVGVPLAQTSELQRQLLGAFAFGMVFTVGQLQKLSPPQVHTLAIALLQDSFDYSLKQAADFADLLIRASADESAHPTIHAVIHRGIDGHHQWQQQQTDTLRANIQQVFQATGADTPPAQSDMVPRRTAGERPSLLARLFSRRRRA